MPFQENTYIVCTTIGPSGSLSDPGLEPDAILDFLDERKLQIAAILNTCMATPDHIAGNETMKDRFPHAAHHRRQRGGPAHRTPTRI